MNNEKTNCCDTNNSDCNTQDTNCCSPEKVSVSSIKKKAGLAVLLLAITFAIISAFSSSNATNKTNCSTGEKNCETSCETGSAGSSCCSKK